MSQGSDTIDLDTTLFQTLDMCVQLRRQLVELQVKYNQALLELVDERTKRILAEKTQVKA